MHYRFPLRSSACARITALACALLAFAAPTRAQNTSTDPIYIFHTNLGDINVQLYPDIAPQTVANFLRYVNRGAYSNSFIHRSPPGFVVQGGGFTFVNGSPSAIPSDPPVALEYHLPNTRGTIAMARTSDLNSATSEWFFNEVDNTTTLGPSNGGGYAVFGKVVDSASLAVMDRLAAIPVVNAQSPFDTLPVINYTSSNTIQADNLVYVNSITALPTWQGRDVSVGSDNNTRVLWKKSDGSINLWKVNPQGQVLTYSLYGPFAGWSAAAIATGSDNYTRILWNKTDGTTAVWTVGPNNSFVTQNQYGPFAGWTARALSVAKDNTVRLLWTKTDGTCAVWNTDAVGAFQFQHQYGPFEGWGAQTLACGPDGYTHLLWDNVNGTAALWRMDLQSVLVDQHQHGPYNGWHAQSVAPAPGGMSRLVWVNNDSHIALWTVGSDGSFLGQTQFGPYAGWGNVSVAVGPDSLTHLLWDNASGQSDLWSLNPNDTFTTHTLYGPY